MERSSNEPMNCRRDAPDESGQSCPAPAGRQPGAPREPTTVADLERALSGLGGLAGAWSVERTRRLLMQRRWTWADARLLVAEVAVDGNAVRDWMPPALAPAAEPRATVFVADYPDTAMGFAYREAGVLLHARLRGRPVLHCAWMVVDDDTALILGRELLGFPKKLATIEFDFDAEAPVATVRRRGIELLRLTGRVDGTAPVGPAFPHPIVNVRGIPGAAPNLAIGMQPNERCRSSLSVELHVATQPSACDPLHRLALDGRHAGRRMIVDLAHPGEPGASLLPAVPVSLVNPAWLWKAYPFRCW